VTFLGRSALKLFPSGYIAGVVSAGGVVAPCYHIVTDGSPAHVRHLYQWRSVQAFQRDLDYLLKHFRPLSLKEICSHTASGSPIPERSLFLSFDDGFREMSEIVAPVCRRKGIPATFFLTTGFLDNKMLGFRHKASLLIDACRNRGSAVTQAVATALSRVLERPAGSPAGVRRLLLSVGYRQRHVLDECAALLEVDFDEYLRTSQPYLTQDHVRSLLADGFSIGGHSIDHPRYADLTLDEQLDQTQGCMEELERRFGLPDKAFAFPFVSDGVPETFYRELFARHIANVVFCIGRMPQADAGKAIQRFGVESEEAHSLPELLGRQAEGRLRQKVATWRRGISTS
jgi:peptidoglycan/xylan/chitin deacetylase (PgdA/CDA1 family)